MTVTTRRIRGVVGESPPRPDGVPKVTGNFAYASDLTADGVLFGATVRSPHARARIVAIDTEAALTIPGVHAVITQADVPGNPVFGQEEKDQPVFAFDEVGFWGEPVAAVAADDPETARLAVAAVRVGYEPLDPLSDPEEAAAIGSVYRELTLRRGDAAASGEVVVEGFYEMRQQDQAPLGPEAGLAIPDGAGGVDLYVTSQWTHVDQEQIVDCLDLAPDQIRQHPVGIGGAFGAREDMNLHIHLCMMALRTGHPIKMVYDRSESFVGHVHRHPARMWYRHEADREGNLVRVDARLLLDGGAYKTTTSAVLANAAYFTVGPYRCPNVTVEATGVRTNNPPAGAMRGFGVPQVCFAAESQMDRLAAELGMHPLEIRRRNALEQGDQLATSGQVIPGPLPTRAVLDALAAIPLPPERSSDDVRALPGGTGLTTPPGAVRRGVGYAAGIKNIAFSEGYDDFAEARVALTPAGAEIYSAAVELGQGMITVCQQIVRTVLGVENVAWIPADTSMLASAGSTSASRQTQMTGSAVLEAAQQVRTDALARAGGDELTGEGVFRNGELAASLEELCAEGPVAAKVRFRHPPTSPGDEYGQGDIHVDYAVAAHRVVVDVDPELGLVRVVAVDTAQDVGKALNPQAVVGQIEGGILQGVGLAVMEELVVEDGVILNPNFTDYLLPTFLDAPVTEAVLIEEGARFGPFGAKGIGEPPTISATPAVVAAIRDATGKDLTRVPVRPDDIVF